MATTNQDPQNLYQRGTINPESPTVTTVLLCAFEGWNDAGSAATEALNHLHSVFDAQELMVFDTEAYYNFSENRPQLSSTPDGVSTLEWPEIRMHQWEIPEENLKIITLLGPEPQLKWKTFTAALLGTARELEVDHLILLGGLLAEVPHTHPFPLSITSYNAMLRENPNVKPQTYNGPTGIIGVLAHSARRFGLTDLSLWISIPHYAGHPPHPKATLRLLRALESILNIAIPLRSVEEETFAWERGAEELMNEEPELADYVRILEEQVAQENSTEVTGEDIAAEFEKFLKRRDL